ncbi:hypothetical protein ACJX0J_019468, partial [Zea mays]
DPKKVDARVSHGGKRSKDDTLNSVGVAPAGARGPPTTRPNAPPQPTTHHLQKALLTAVDPPTANALTQAPRYRHRQVTPSFQRASHARGHRHRWPATATQARRHRRRHHGCSSRKATRPC